jgi:hypothetical protein
MKRSLIAVMCLACALIMLPSFSAAQKTKAAKSKGTPTDKEVYTGTIVNMSGRSASIGFNLTLTGRTSDAEAQQYLQILANEGQDDFLKAISKNDLGYIAATGQTRRDLLVVRENQINGQRRIIAAFERWQGFWEVRGGYRSTDYAFSIIEIVFDQKGRGTGTFIGLAQIRMKMDKKTEQWRLEIENFGSFPSKVMGVIRRS